jgi:hypothetical protein
MEDYTEDNSDDQVAGSCENVDRDGEALLPRKFEVEQGNVRVKTGAGCKREKYFERRQLEESFKMESVRHYGVSLS